MLFKSDFWDTFTDLESIVWLHEFGHNLGLCHRPEDKGEVAVGPGGPGGCSACGTGCNCTHYAVDEDSDTAMGSNENPVGKIVDGIDREVDYADSEWAVIDLTTISSSSNCP